MIWFRCVSIAMILPRSSVSAAILGEDAERGHGGRGRLQKGDIRKLTKTGGRWKLSFIPWKDRLVKSDPPVGTDLDRCMGDTEEQPQSNRGIGLKRVLVW